jgi:hypothetical protein
MKSLYQTLRDANPDGIPSDEAVQLFLWTFCTKDVLPVELRKLPLTKEVLAETFQRLTSDGLIRGAHPDADNERSSPDWNGLVREFLLKRVELDDTFRLRAKRYFQATLSTIQDLVGAALDPVEPAPPYAPAREVVLWRSFNDGRCVQEIFRRSEGIYGFRYVAWVAWRDAGGTVRNHAWHRLTGVDAVLTDSADSAAALAVADLRRRGALECGNWNQGAD